MAGRGVSFLLPLVTAIVCCMAAAGCSLNGGGEPSRSEAAWREMKADTGREGRPPDVNEAAIPAAPAIAAPASAHEPVPLVAETGPTPAPLQLSPSSALVSSPALASTTAPAPSSAHVPTTALAPSSELAPTTALAPSSALAPAPAPSTTLDPPPASNTSAERQSAAATTTPASPATTATQPQPVKTRIAIPVLNYHSISDSEPGNSAVMPVAKFEEQLAYLAREGYTPLTLAEYIAILEGAAPSPAKPILLTFDDGYADNYSNAMPLLKQYDFPATLFMSPGTVDDPYYLSWEQVDQLHQAGWDIQPHGMTHPHLPQLDAAQQEAEIAEAKRLIEERYGTAALVYCYPYGERNATTLKLLAKHHYRYAFTIDQGRSTNEQPPYELKRIFVNGNEGLPEFVRKLSWK